MWLIVIATGVFAFSTRARMIVRGDATATATNIVSSESLFRLSIASDVISFACYVILTVILYELMKPVSRSLSMLAAVSGLAGCVIGSVLLALLLLPAVLLGDTPYLTAFEPSQLHALALASVRLHGQAYDIGWVFFGLQCMIIGYLIVRSNFLPRLLGAMLGIGGASYVVSGFASVVSPSLGVQIYPYVAGAALVGEGSLSLWLAMKGLDLSKWEEQSRRSPV